jgi:hypothetical protein
MKLCMDCKHYGGIQASNGKYICREPRAAGFIHPVDGLPYALDASWLRMTPEYQYLCGMDAKWWEKKSNDIK